MWKYFRNPLITRFFVIILAFAGMDSSLCAQEKELASPVAPVGIFESREEYNQFFGGLKSLGDPEVNAMLPMINDFVLGRPIGSTPLSKVGGNGVMELLGDRNVRRELEIADFQYENLKSLNADVRKKMAAELKAVDFSNAKDLAEQIRNARDRAEKQLQDVLLPHQMKRLRQLSAQSQLRRRSLAELLASAPLKDELKLTESQGNDLREAELAIEEKLAVDIAKLRKQARDEILSRLHPTQRKRVNEIFGDVFEFSDGKSELESKLSK